MTCRQIREEQLAIYYNETTFVFDGQWHNASSLFKDYANKWVSKIEKYASQIRSVAVHGSVGLAVPLSRIGVDDKICIVANIAKDGDRVRLECAHGTTSWCKCKPSWHVRDCEVVQSDTDVLLGALYACRSEALRISMSAAMACEVCGKQKIRERDQE